MTGVQTCALPILHAARRVSQIGYLPHRTVARACQSPTSLGAPWSLCRASACSAPGSGVWTRATSSSISPLSQQATEAQDFPQADARGDLQSEHPRERNREVHLGRDPHRPRGNEPDEEGAEAPRPRRGRPSSKLGRRRLGGVRWRPRGRGTPRLKSLLHVPFIDSLLSGAPRVWKR